MGREERKIKREERKRITIASTLINSEFNNNSSSQTTISSSFMSISMLVYSGDPYQLLFHSSRAQLFHPLSINLLYWAHWACIPIILGQGLKIVTLQLASSVGIACVPVQFNGYDEIRSASNQSAPGENCQRSSTG